MKTFNKILLHIPHCSNCNSTLLWENPLQFNHKCVRKHTDWYTDIIFGSSRPEMESIVFPYSRFYVDAERQTVDPLQGINQAAIYTRYEVDGETFTRIVPQDFRTQMLEHYLAHHKRMSEAVVENTLVIDCHSFPQELSDVDVCIGLNDDDTRPNDLFVEAVRCIFTNWGYKVAINTLDSNSIFVDTDKSYKSMKIELNKSVYLDEHLQSIKDHQVNSIMTAIQEMYSLALGYRETEIDLPIIAGNDVERPFKVGDRVIMTEEDDAVGKIILISPETYERKGKFFADVSYLVESQDSIYCVHHDDLFPAR